MSTADRVKQQVLDYIKSNIRDRFPKITDDMLIENGTVFYMNGNDGTDFDFGMNDRTCELMSFYKSSNYGFFKIFVTRSGLIDGYAYLEEGHGEAIRLEPKHVGAEEAKESARALQLSADNLKKWDCNIEDIVFKTRK